MKPAPFRYYRARSLLEALDFLNGPAVDGKLLAGGQSLIPLLNLRLARPEALIDLNPISDLSYIRKEGAEIVIGALTRQREMEYSALLAKELPIVGEAMPQIGHPAIRNRGTLGGSVAHADPAAELPCLLTALDGRFIAAGPHGERMIRAEDFFIGLYTTALSHQEILKEVRIPLARRPVGWSFVEFARRHGDFALSEVSALLYAEENADRCSLVRLVVGGSVEKPLRLAKVEKLIRDEVSLGMEEEPLRQLLMQAERSAEAEMRTSVAAGENSEYVCHLSGVLARRALQSAIARWGQR